MTNSLAKTAQQLHRHYNTLITGDVHPSDHSVEKGGAREHGWRKLLRRFLPERYGVKSGFIVDSSGQISEQIDCIIYRKDTGIELYSVGNHTVIPAEVVFCAFEIKPAIDGKTLKYAEDKAISVTNLRISNYLAWNKNTGEREDYLKTELAEGAIILGLLADRVDSTKKWKLTPFRNLIKQQSTKSSVFMTIENGCVDTLDTGYPTNEYTFCEGNHALLNQLIRLAKSIARLEEGRCLDSCCLAEYKVGLDDPKKVKF